MYTYLTHLYPMQYQVASATLAAFPFPENRNSLYMYSIEETVFLSNVNYIVVGFLPVPTVCGLHIYTCLVVHGFGRFTTHDVVKKGALGSTIYI